MTSETIPPELIDLIIDALADCKRDSTAQKTLRDCLFVSRCVRDRARHRILSEVVLANSREKFLSRIRLLRELLNSGPDSLSRYVKRFSLWQHAIAIDDINSDGVLASVLSKLCAEGALEFLDMDLSLYAIEWEGIHPGLQRTLHDICHSRCLKAVVLRGFSGLPSTFFNGTSLNSICLGNTRSGPAIEETNQPPPAMLRSFQTDFLFIPPISWTSSQHGISPFALLQSLTVSIKTESHFAAACGICSAALSSLECLRFFLPPDPHDFKFDFNQLSSLKTLYLYQEGSPVAQPWDVKLDPTNIYHLLHSPLPPTLQTIHIRFSANYSCKMEERLPVFHDSGWSAFDYVLSHPRFATVSLIGVAVCVLCRLEIEEQEDLLLLFVEGLRRLLSNICATKQANVLFEAVSILGCFLRVTQECKSPGTITIGRTES